MSEPPRRSKRALPAASPDNPPPAQPTIEATGSDNEEEEEVTRCLCGQQEYPGPPLSPAFTTEDTQSDDAGAWFISCDGCHVWQHGGCVGLADESQSPEKYFCEECRPKSHDKRVDSRGQRYSLYLPVTSKIAARKNSISSRSDERSRKERAEISRGSIDPASGKRRGTIRSREHDDEAEQIQRAIEESKREVEGDGKSSKSSNGTKRSGKRSREDSSEDRIKQETKRQRRGSEAYPAALRTSAIEDDTDDEEENTPASRAKKARADAVQTARQIEQREKEKERERARAEAAGRRQQRAGRRRDGEPSDETPNPTRTSPLASSQPESPPPESTHPEKISHKKGAGAKRVKRLGNNQYTKHRPDGTTTTLASSPQSRKRHLHASTSLPSSGDEAPATHSGGSTSTPVDPTPATATLTTKGKVQHKSKAHVKADATNPPSTSASSTTAAAAERSVADMLRTVQVWEAMLAKEMREAEVDRVRSGFAVREGRDREWEEREGVLRGLREMIERGPEGVEA
ncbi:Histone deacetylase complex subunit [Oleoguttula sp. CCFEE 5521]